jgi:hypothetical protein
MLGKTSETLNQIQLNAWYKERKVIVILEGYALAPYTLVIVYNFDC